MIYHCEKRDLRSLEDEWREMEYNNCVLTPQNYYDYTKVLTRQYWPYALRGEKPMFLRLSDHSGKCVMIAPVAKRKDRITTLGAMPKIAFQGFCYDSRKLPDFNECMKAIFAATGEQKIIVNHVRTDSPFYFFAEAFGQNFKTHENAGIPLPNDVDEYTQSLSKSTRQNLRTAVNRLKRDGHSYELRAVTSNEFTKEIEREVMACYIKRREAKRSGNSFLIPNFFTRHIHYNTVAFRQLENCLHFLLYIDNSLAAFMSGYTDKASTTYLVPRLAFDEDFCFYDPGNLLILMTAQWLITNTTIRFLDLSRGDDGYKYKMGGVKYYTYDYMFLNNQNLKKTGV